MVVLNLAIEYFPSVISDKLHAVAADGSCCSGCPWEVVLLLKGWVVAHPLRAADSRRAKVAIGLLLWVVAAGRSWLCSAGRTGLR